MSIAEIQSYYHNLQVLGSLKENERLVTNGRHFSKMQAPDRFFKNREHPLAKIAHQVLTLVLKIFQAVERFIRGQHSHVNIRKIDKMAGDLLDLFKDGKIPDPSDDASYDALRDLGKAAHQLQNCADRSLAQLEKTLIWREAFLDSTVSLKDAVKGNHVRKVTAKIANEVFPKISELIETVEAGLYNKDRNSADAFFEKLFNKQDVDQTLRISSRAAIDSLEKRLGKPAIIRALELYGLSHDRVLNGKDLIAITTGALANLTDEDLPYLRSDGHSESAIGISLTDLRKKIDLTVLEPTEELSYGRQLEHDQTVLKSLCELEEWKAEAKEGSVQGLKHYSYAEYLSRHVVYALFNKSRTQFADGLIIPLYDKHNQLRLFTAHRLVSKKGLYGLMLKPLNQRQDQNDVHIVFRGTYCKSSLLRDISPNEKMQNHLFDGPGRYSFTKHQDAIYKNIIENLKDVVNPTAEFHGHSLGASDAKRAMEYFMYKQSELKGSLPVKKYVLNAFNTPAIEPDLARRFMESLRALKVETDLRYFDVKHDFIQELGSTRLGYWRSNETCPDFLKISVFTFDRRIEERIVALARNIFRRMKFRAQKALEAHTFYCLRLHDTDRNTELNSTFIQGIHTNHPADVGVVYGKNLDNISEKTANEEVDDHLLTASCLFGRSIKRKVLKVQRVFTVSFRDTP